MRLFFGGTLPDAFRARVAALQARLGRVNAAVRWVDPSSAHFTLKFLGEVTAEELGDVDAAGRRTAASGNPCRLRIRKLGSFPARSHPRVVWVGVRDETETLVDLHQALEAALADAGFDRERRPFRPHVTLGRIKGRRGLDDLRAAMADETDVDLGTMTLRKMTLFESRLSRRGPRYEVIGTYGLGG